MSGKLQKLFDLKEEAPCRYRADFLWQSEGSFVANGGHLVSMAIGACNRTITQQGLFVHSVHGCFLRPGNNENPAHLQLDKTKDGKSFSSRSVTISQGEKPIFTMLASYHNEAKEASHVLNVKCDMPAVTHHSQIESLHTIIDDLTANIINPDSSIARPEDVKSFLRDFPLELKPLVPAQFINRTTGPSSDLQFWLRLNNDIGNDQNHHRALLAFFSDIATLYGPLSNKPELEMTWAASLDHSIWFHSTVNMNEWLFYETTCTNMNFGIGLVKGRMWNEDGELVATIMQETLFRTKL